MATPDSPTPGRTLRTLVEEQRPLPITGTVNAYCALLAERAGWRALYLSGAGVANASLGLPDLGVTTLNDVLEDARRITAATQLPLLVDADTGWGNSLMIRRTVSELIRAGAAGMHLEDQIAAKRCGHRPGKQVVTCDEMCDRLKAALDARSDASFVVMARTDAAAVEGLDAAIERACRYAESGADMIFAEALTTLEEYQRFTSGVNVPVLANVTEFGRTPLFSIQELASVGIRIVLFPLSAFRAMSSAADRVYRTLLEDGKQTELLDAMQTREDLYDVLQYPAAEEEIDQTGR